MLLINYTGTTPEKPSYDFAVQGNSNANVIRFLLATNQDDVDLSSLTPYLKVESLGKDYLDKIDLTEHTTIDNITHKVQIEWTMDALATANKYLKLQLMFEDYPNHTVWQTEIVKLRLINSIDIDSDMCHRYPQVISYLINAVKNIPTLLAGTGITIEENGTEKTIKVNGDYVMTLSTNQTVTSLKIFNVLPQSEATPTDEKDLATKKYIDNLISLIQAVIPDDASVSNKLVSENVVNQKISTSDAEFKGTFNSVEELPTEDVDNNDYAWVVSTDESGNTIYSKYIFVGSSETWVFEWSISNILFNAEQWDALNSGINAILTNYLKGIKDGIIAVPKALGDEEGNNIKDTYQRKSDILGAVLLVQPYDEHTGKIKITELTEVVSVSYDEHTGILTIEWTE